MNSRVEEIFAASLLERPYPTLKILSQKGTYLCVTLATIPAALVKILLLTGRKGLQRPDAGVWSHGLQHCREPKHYTPIAESGSAVLDAPHRHLPS